MRSWLPWRALTILAVVTVLIAAGPLATAADGSITVRAPVTDATAVAGSDVSFAFSIRNSHSTFQHSVTIELADNDGAWPVNVTPQGRVDVPANGWRNGTVVVTVPANATPEDAREFVLVVTDKTGPLAADRVLTLNFTVTVDAPRVHSSGGPRLTLTPVNDSVQAAPGETVTRSAVVKLEGADYRLVHFTATAPENWTARPQYAMTTVRDESRLVSVTFTVPEDAVVNASHVVQLHARADDGSTGDDAAWAVTIVPPAPDASTSTADADANESTATNESTSAHAPPEEPAPDGDAGDASASGDDSPAPRVLELLTLTLDAPALTVAPGESVVSTLTLTNPGDADRAVTLTVPVEDGWRVTFEEGSAVTVPASGERLVRFSVTAPADAAPGDAVTTLVRAEEATGELALTVQSPATAPDAEAADADDLATQDAPVNAPLDAVLARYGAGPVFVAAGAVTAVSGGIWLRGAPHVRRNLWWIGIGAYTRLSRPKLLDHAERQRLHATIQENPGIHFHALQRELGWNTGALTYHLRVLERHQLITSRRDGIMRRFYLVGTAPREMPKAVNASGKAVTLTGIRGSVITIVNHRGRVPQAALVDELGTSKQAINYHVKNLERLGLLRVERVGRETFLSPAEDVQLTGLEHADAVAPNADATAARPGPGIALASGDDR